MSWFGMLAAFSEEVPESERRKAVRRKLRLESVLGGGRSPDKVVVLDLSQAGVMLHSPQELEVGEVFAVELPIVGLVDARVVWRRTTLHGCEFVEPVRRAAISAALLRAVAASTGQEHGDGD